MVWALALAGAGRAAAAEREYVVRGMVLQVDPATRSLVVSHEKVDGLMDAMTMPFEVRDPKDLEGLAPGAIVSFTLVVTGTTSYARRVELQPYRPVDLDPLTAARLALMRRLAGTAARPVGIGQKVPDFRLLDQAGRPVTLSSLAGKVVVLSFIYTRCALPQYCLRVTSSFNALHKQFAPRLGKELVLLTVTFDPQRDTPDVMAKYAAQWHPDAEGWRFLSGEVKDVRRVCDLFGVDYFADDGLMSHSLRTAIVDRSGTLAASIQGNEYTPRQLGDLVASALRAR